MVQPLLFVVVSLITHGLDVEVGELRVARESTMTTSIPQRGNDSYYTRTAQSDVRVCTLTLVLVL